MVLTVSDYFTKMVDKITQKSKSYTIRPMIPYKVTDIITGREYEQKSQYNLLYLGRMNAQKGLVELLHAARILKDRDRFNFQLHLVGGGEFSEQVKAEISHLGLADVVFFKGAIYDDTEKMQCYRQSDLYVLPTYHEGFPRTLYEAMIAGTPIVTTFVGGISSVMRDGVNCLRIEPRSVESIVDVLSLALANYQDMGRLATNGRETVRRILQRKSHAQLLNDVLMDTKDDMRAV